MRIACIHWAFPPTKGGVETHLATLLPELVKLNHKVFLLTEYIPKRSKVEDFKGVKVHRSKIMNLSNYVSNIPVYKNEYERLYEEVEREIGVWIKKIKPDLVHAHNLNCFVPYHGVACEVICEKMHIPLILTVHQVWPNNPSFVAYTKRIKWTKIIAVSKFVKSELVKLGIEKKKIEVVYHGLDPTRFRPRSEAELKSLFKKYPKLKNKRIILHPARIDEFKGTEYGIRAMAIVKKSFPDAILVLTGAGKQVSFFGDIDPYMKKIANLIEELKLKKHVMLADFSMDDVLMLYSASDVVINPTAGSYEKGDEAFGLVTIEGNASGKPVIVSTSGALPEIIKHGFNGFVVPKRDHIALANSIIKLLSNDELRKKMGENGRKLVEQKFTIERMVKNTIDVYKSTVK